MTNRMKGFDDKAARKDELGLQKYFDGLADFIRECPTPMTIAIQGGWGSGKTSAMNMIRNNLQESNDLLLVDFNTWQYARAAGDSLFLPLLRRLGEAIKKEIKGIVEESRSNKKAYSKTFKDGNKVVAAGMGVIAEAIRICTDAGAEVLDFLSGNEKEKDLSEEAGAVYDNVEKLKEILDTEIEFLENRLGIHRVVFFVDDLDRLEPEVAVSFLEDLKNFLENDHFVFVLALDHEIVWRGIQHRYSINGTDNSDEAKEYSSKFFDKLIQLPFNLPQHQYNVEQYIDSLLGNSEAGFEFARIIRVFGDTNPRAIKRVLNIFQMYQNIKDQPYQGHDCELLSLLLLQMNHTDLYKNLLKAIGEDLSDPEEKILRVSGEKNIINKHVDKWFEKPKAAEDMEERHSERDLDIGKLLKELFTRKDDSVNTYQLLFDIVGATAVTGDSFENNPQKVEETRKLIENYIMFLGFSKTESGVYTSPTNDKVSVSISTPGTLKDHVNLNITSKDELHYKTAEERVKFFKERLLPGEIFTVLTEKPAPDNQGGMDIIFNQTGTCVLRNIFDSDSASMLFAGKVLRNIAREGKIFTEGTK